MFKMIYPVKFSINNNRVYNITRVSIVNPIKPSFKSSYQQQNIVLGLLYIMLIINYHYVIILIFHIYLFTLPIIQLLKQI